MGYIFIFITPIINLFLFELYFFQLNFFYFSISIINLLILLSIKEISKEKLLSKELWTLNIMPILFINSTILYSTLIINNFIIQSLFVINTIFTFYFLKNIFFRKDETKNKHFFENISSYGNFLIVFFAGAGIYGLKSFLNTPIWILIIILAIIIILIIYESIWANKINIRKGSIYIFISCLMLVQIAWSIYFLPLNFNVLGLILAICYYILIGVIKYSLRSNLTKKTIKLYLIFGFLSIALILLTAKWT